MIRSQQLTDEERCRKESENFVLTQALLLAALILLLAVTAAGTVILSITHPDSVAIERKGFGEGDKEIPLVLSRQGANKQYLFKIGEKEITPKEEERMFKSLFKELGKEMSGENVSLEQVKEQLNFPSSLKGYPFSLSYQPADIDVIDLNGALGKKATELHSDPLQTDITVTAVYEAHRQTHIYHVAVIAGDAKKKTQFEKAREELVRQEEESRNQSRFNLPSSVMGIKVKGPENNPFFTLMVSALLITAAIPFYRHFSMRDKAERSRIESEKDFSLIVHLFALFMGTGLSFQSSVARINQAYTEGKLTPQRRAAFDRIESMERMMRDGLSSKEALKKWAAGYSFPGYQKLALILIQCLTKGQKEAVMMMEKEERRAFADRIDKARKEGEEAGTGLLFPMVVLLAATMILIMFPAIVAFYRY